MVVYSSLGHFIARAKPPECSAPNEMVVVADQESSSAYEFEHGFARSIFFVILTRGIPVLCTGRTG